MLSEVIHVRALDKGSAFVRALYTRSILLRWTRATWPHFANLQKPLPAASEGVAAMLVGLGAKSSVSAKVKQRRTAAPHPRHRHRHLPWDDG